MSDNEPSVTDSPWLWLAIFIAGGIVALVLASPKYAWRQPELEREYLARQRGGQTVARHDEPTGEFGQPTISLRPLLMAFTVAFLTLCWVFWFLKWLRSR